MKKTINLYDFREAFRTMGRKDNFTYNGLEVLFDYLEEIEQGSGEEMELDVIGLCCDFAEATLFEIADTYSIDLSEAEDDTEKHGIVREWLEENGAYVGDTEDTLVYYSNF